MSYTDNPLLEEIRKEYGSLRTTSQGIASTSESVQDEFRFSEPEGRESGDHVGNSRDQLGTGDREDATIARFAQGRDSGEGRADHASSQDSGGVNRRDRSIDSQISATKLTRKLRSLNEKYPSISYTDAARQAKCSYRTAKKWLDLMRAGETQDDGSEGDEEDDTPHGIESQPHYKEQAIRREQQQEQEQQARQASESKKQQSGLKGLYSFVTKSKEKSHDKKKHSRDTPFSEAEAEAIREPFLAALMDYFKYTDEFIYATHKAHNQVQIWSSIDSEDAGILVDVWLVQAKKSAIAASHITNIVNSHYQLRVGIILAPRFYATFRVYVEGGGIDVR